MIKIFKPTRVGSALWKPIGLRSLSDIAKIEKLHRDYQEYLFASGKQLR